MPNADRSGKEPFFRGKGFLPGRQLVELGPAYEDRYGAADVMNYLKEDLILIRIWRSKFF